MKSFYLIIFICCCSVAHSQNVTFFFDDATNLFGLKQKTGKIIVAPVYDDVEDFKEGLAAVMQNNKWGFINSKGKLVIPYQFGEVESSFCRGKAEVFLNGYLTEIDTKGNEIPRRAHWEEYLEKHKLLTKYQLDKIRVHPGGAGEDGLFFGRSKKTKKWGFFQIYGEEYDDLQILVPAEYDSISNMRYNANFVAVYQSNQVGIYQTTARNQGEKPGITIPCAYEDYKITQVYSPSFEWYGEVPFLALKKNGKWAWVDWFTGELKTPFDFDKYEDLPPIKSEWVKW